MAKSKSKYKFEEALYKCNEIRKIIPLQEIDYMREHDLEHFCAIKNHLYCPDCEIPQLSHNECEMPRNNYLSTRNLQSHAENCIFNVKKASRRQLKKLVEGDENLNHMNQRLRSLIISSIKEKKVTPNPLIITTAVKVCKNNESQRNEHSSGKAYIPRKRFDYCLSEDDVNEYKMFYGHAKLVCKKLGDGYVLRFYSSESSQLYCSLTLSKTVFTYLGLKEAEYKPCHIAFFAELQMNETEKYGVKKSFFNGKLTDSRLIASVK